jgi:hypothetical protein
MSNERARPNDRGAWPWWALAALLAVAVVIDAIDGAPLKLATSCLLLAASLLVALTRPPRSKAVMRLALALSAAAVALLVVRVTVAGL